jgi:diketogulonate reductase-like aldo/keto reductase
VKTATTRTGARLPALGLGTWRMGESARKRKADADALRYGFDLGLTLVDTAEMYASGGAEEVVGDALQGRRDSIFLVTKVLPENASRRGTLEACERSLRRLRTDHIDLYLLHWPSAHPLEETLSAFTSLRAAGKILHYGVSNFDRGAMERAEALPGGSAVTANQVYYSLERRGIESRLVPWCAERAVAVMAYSPLEQGRLRVRPALREVARRHGVSPQTAALAWTIRLDGVTAVVKSSRPEHLRAIAAGASVGLTREDLEDLDAAYPAPRGDAPLDML